MKRFFLKRLYSRQKFFSRKIMLSNSETAIEASSYTTITLYFLTTASRSYFFSKVTGLSYPRGYMMSFRRWYDIYTTSYRLLVDVELTLSVSGMQLYKTINSVKSIFLPFSAVVPNSYHVVKVSENTYFVFCILYNAFQRLLLVDTSKKKVSWMFHILVPRFCNVQLDKAKSEDKFFLVIKIIYLIWNTFLSLLYI